MDKFTAIKPDANTLTQTELCYRWKIGIKSVRANVRKFGLEPADFIGIQPVFKLADVLAMEARRLKYRAKQIGIAAPGQIITVKKAKKLACK